MPTILENDSLFAGELPKYTVVTASAGSGKTTALKQRFVQILLSKMIPSNNLKNVLAITFTNNAAREMKQRVLGALKLASLGKPDTLEELAPLLSLTRSELQLQADRLVEEILDNYSDFQIQTIDSFLARVFKASALELGLSPDLEIVLDSDAILDDAFDLFARELSQGTDSARLLTQLLDLLLESRAADDRFLWNPYPDLAAKVKDLYKRIILTTKQLRLENHAAAIRNDESQIIQQILELDVATNRPRVVKSKRFETLVESARSGDIDGILNHKLPFPPVTKSGSGLTEYERTLADCQSLCNDIAQLRGRLIVLKARQHYQPYAEAHTVLSRSIDAVKREQSKIDIADVIKKLAEYLKPGIVPEIYYSLGETLCHYLIDEFQDTNPIQWETIEPLVGNAVSMKGSLFVVGDMKQSIYGFRGADWTIMKRLRDENVFPSAKKDPKTLATNYRSFEKILRFNDDVFKNNVPGKAIAGAEQASGLAIDAQLVKEGFRGKGYVELTSFAADAEADDSAPLPERQKLLAVVADCLTRGYQRSDITILSPRNRDIVEVSGWLNETGISFVSHSSLDVRSRKVTGELLGLLQFLDSPIDDLSFATFILSDVFERLLRQHHQPVRRQDLLDFLFTHRLTPRHDRPLYLFFRETYPDLWQEYFENLFNVVGYLPVYDLISETYKSFSIFSLLPDEEATLVKILEVVKDFEERAENTLKAFLHYAEESSEDADWNVDIPTDIDAVKVMTIHKAKGLESKVVIVLLYDSQPRRDSLYLEEGDDGVRLIRLTKDLAEKVPELAQLYHVKELRHTVDDLNKLYVAFTRAEEEMYILSVKAHRGKVPSEFLPASGYEAHQKPMVERSAAVAEGGVELCHDLPRSDIRPAEYAGIAFHETRRGEFFHAVLENIEYTDEKSGEILEAAIRQAQIRMPFDRPVTEISNTLKDILLLPDLHPYFIHKEGRTVLNEQEFVANDGALVRMDRVVVDPSVITVIDYKTGDKKPEYSEQIKKYLNVLRNFYKDRIIRGLLVYIDHQRIHAVS